MLRRWCIGILLGWAAGVAQAQVVSPARPPALPGAGLPGAGDMALGLEQGVGRIVSGLGDDVDVQALRDLHRRRMADLIRRYPRLIERDPRGNAIVRSEVLVFSPTDAALDRARAAGFSLVRDQALGSLGVRIVVLRAPDGVPTQQALEQLRTLDPTGTYDFNHLYSESGAQAQADPAESAQMQAASRPPLDASVNPSAARVRSHDAANIGHPAVRVGLIDSGVETDHPVLKDVPVLLHGCAGAVVPSEHGTEVASLLVGRSDRFRGSAPGAALFAADVYCGAPTGGAVDDIADAFEWLVHERVPVINVSLVGPPNLLLARLVRSVIAHRFIIVAAVGNDGPAAPPLYPAAYPGVIGVTGVDARRHVLMEAERGPQVRFAAPGADMAAALPPRAFAVVRGTSFAAPIVAGLLAPALDAPDPARAQRAIDELERRAADLGAPGADPVYGYGLVGAGLRPEPALARAQ